MRGVVDRARVALLLVVLYRINFGTHRLDLNIDTNEQRFSKVTAELLQCPDGFTLLQDNHTYIAAESKQSSSEISPTPTRIIPRIFHQTAPTRCIDNLLYEQTVSKWLNLGWSYEFADDKLMENFLSDPKWEKQFPHLPLALKCIDYANKPVMKADLWRYLVLYEKGGIYADLDVMPDPSFDDSTLAQHDAVFVRCDDSRSSTPSQWFFAAAPQHPIMRDAILFATDNVLWAKRTLPIHQTGPGALYKAVASFTGGQERSLRDNAIYEKNNRSFVTIPSHMARNQAAKQRQESYIRMNITNYFTMANAKARTYGGKTCVEYLNGTQTDDPDGFVLNGNQYQWYRGKN